MIATGRRLAAVLVAVLVAGLAAACGSSPEESGVPVDAVLVAVVRSVTGETPATTEAGPLPVVYVVSTAEDGLSPGDQAAVASQLRDDVDVRFADRREEALDDAEPGVPVVDAGVLLVVGEIPARGGVVELPVEVYRDAGDHRALVFTLRAAGDEQWAVTATSAAPLPGG